MIPARAFARIALSALLGFATLHDCRATIRNRNDLRLWLGGRALNQNRLSAWDKTTDTYGVFGSHWSGVFPWVRFEFRPELRLMAGDSVGLPASDVARASAEPPSQFLKMQWKLFADENREGYFSIERANLTLPIGDAELSVGRKVLSLGTLKVIPIWNRLSRPLPTAFGPETLIFGRDQASLRYQNGNIGFFGFWVEGPTQTAHPTLYRDRMLGGEITGFFSWLEWHLMVGQWFERTVYGGAFAKDIGGLTWTGESLFYDDVVQLGSGAEYAWNEDLSTLIEGIYSGSGATHPDQYEIAPKDPLYSFRARYYVYAQARYQFATDFYLQPSVVFNAIDYSSWVTGRVEWMINEDSDVAVQGSVPVGVSGTEFSRSTFVFPNGGRLGSSANLSVEYKVFF